jgi:methionine synthase II (cobalamin-independent)
MPGDNPLETAQLIYDELPGLPFLAELPGRGPGADIIGRTAALLVDIPVDVTPRGWRIAERRGRDMSRARTMLSSDLDAMEEVLYGFDGPLKVQLAGPWTLAAAIEKNRSLSPALADPGLVADLTASLAEGAAAHVAEVAKRVPAATICVQFDEPSLPAVAHGAIPTASGLSRVRPVGEEVLRDRLGTVLAATRLAATRAYTIVHCCASGYPFEIINGAGANAVSFDLSLVKHSEYDKLAETVEGGSGLLIGALSVTGLERDSPRPRSRAEVSGRGAAVQREDEGERSRPSPRGTANSIREVWQRIGLTPASCAEQVVITPACGLAGVSPGQARDALRWCREAARILPELMAELA